MFSFLFLPTGNAADVTHLPNCTIGILIVTKPSVTNLPPVIKFYAIVPQQPRVCVEVGIAILDLACPSVCTIISFTCYDVWSETTSQVTRKLKYRTSCGVCHTGPTVLNELFSYLAPIMVSIRTCLWSFVTLTYISHALQLWFRYKATNIRHILLCPLSDAYRSKWTFFILGNNDYKHQRMCRA